MEVLFFDEKVRRFVNELELPVSAKVFRTLQLLERFGQTLGLPHSRHMSRSLLELRVRGNQEIRLIYTFYKGTALVLHGFLKKSQKIPRK